MSEPGDEAVRDAREAEAYLELRYALGNASVIPSLRNARKVDECWSALRTILFEAGAASERAKVEALLEAVEATIVAADESRAQARAQWEAQMATGFPCRICGAPARHWESSMSGNWNSPASAYPACNDHATFYHFYSADLSGIRAAIDAVRAWRAS